MGKQGRQKQTALTQPTSTAGLVTHEPARPMNWPLGHVNVQETGNAVQECIRITVHGVHHYLHATTAYELYKMLGTTIRQWDAKSKAHGAPGVIELTEA